MKNFTNTSTKRPVIEAWCYVCQRRHYGAPSIRALPRYQRPLWRSLDSLHGSWIEQVLLICNPSSVDSCKMAHTQTKMGMSFFFFWGAPSLLVPGPGLVLSADGTCHHIRPGYRTRDLLSCIRSSIFLRARRRERGVLSQPPPPSPRVSGTISPRYANMKEDLHETRCESPWSW